jgi:Uma2 family endonuclease
VKLAAYARAGLPEYAIVDPGTRTLTHHRLEAPGRYMAPRIYQEDESMSCACLPTINVSVGDLCAGAPDTAL